MCKCTIITNETKNHFTTENKAQLFPLVYISLPPYSPNSLRLLACSCVGCNTGKKPTSQGRFGLRQAREACQKTHTTCSKEGADPPLASSGQLQEAPDYADTALEEGLSFCKHSGICNPSLFCPVLWIIIRTTAEGKAERGRIPSWAPWGAFCFRQPGASWHNLVLACEHEMNICWGAGVFSWIMMVFGVLGLHCSVSWVELSWHGGCVQACHLDVSIPAIWLKPAHLQLPRIKVLAHEKLESSDLELWVLGHCSRCL